MLQLNTEAICPTSFLPLVSGCSPPEPVVFTLFQGPAPSSLVFSTALTSARPGSKTALSLQ